MITENEVREWHTCQTELKRLKAREMYLRKQIVAEISPGSGANTIDRSIHGFELKAELKVNYSINKETIDALYEHLTFYEKECIKWTPSIKVKEYNALDEPGANLLKSQIVTVKPAAPALTVLSELE